MKWQYNKPESGLLCVEGGNYVLKGKGFFISYNPSPCSGMAMFYADSSRGETALVKDDVFLILNGDFRKRYEKVASKGFEACLALYRKNLKHKSSWSSKLTKLKEKKK